MNILCDNVSLSKVKIALKIKGEMKIGGICQEKSY